MKRIAQLLIAVTLVGSASAQTSFFQKIKEKFSSSPSPNTAKPSAGQSQPAKTAAPAPAKSAGNSAPVAKPAASKPAASITPVANTTKNSTPAAKPVSATPSKQASNTSSKPAGVAAKGAVAPAKPALPAKQELTKISIAPIAPQPKQGAQKSGPFAPPKKNKVVKAAAQPEGKPAAQTSEAAAPAAAENNKEKKMITADGRRDPFLSPVVNSATGPACSTGKRCLEIDQIVVRGVVKSDNGMIAVVVNALNKAYFLKENDPVYNGYVLKITGDSVVFKETYQDKLGKEFTREIVKKLTTPAV
ncbi:MAG TPA: hypothetical protein VMT53_13835 [Terriglobales bacterium]|nr:hypothetical protein [Terriglobales bacterium]